MRNFGPLGGLPADQLLNWRGAIHLGTSGRLSRIVMCFGMVASSRASHRLPTPPDCPPRITARSFLSSPIGPVQCCRYTVCCYGSLAKTLGIDPRHLPFKTLSERNDLQWYGWPGRTFPTVCGICLFDVFLDLKLAEILFNRHAIVSRTHVLCLRHQLTFTLGLAHSKVRRPSNGDTHSLFFPQLWDVRVVTIGSGATGRCECMSP